MSRSWSVPGTGCGHLEFVGRLDLSGFYAKVEAVEGQAPPVWEPRAALFVAVCLWRGGQLGA